MSYVSLTAAVQAQHSYVARLASDWRDAPTASPMRGTYVPAYLYSHSALCSFSMLSLVLRPAMSSSTAAHPRLAAWPRAHPLALLRLLLLVAGVCLGWTSVMRSCDQRL